MARFFIHATFSIVGKSLFVLCGEIISGEIATGMELHLPHTPNVGKTLKVHSLEHVHGPENQSQVGLTVQYKDDDELSFLKSLNIDQTEVSVFQAQSETS